MDTYYNSIDTTECFIYYIAGPLWNELKNLFNTKKETYIASTKFINLQKNKIIFILISANKVFKLVSICTTKRNQCINSDNIKVFNSQKLNENIVEVNNIFVFDNIIVPDALCNEVDTNNTSLKKISSDLAVKIMELIKSNTQNDTDSCTHINSEYNSDDISVNGNDGTKNCNSNDSNSDDTNTKDSGRTAVKGAYNRCKIPIKIYKCDDFEWGTKKRDYFKKHYKTCKQCEIINNNDSDLIQIIDDCVMNFHKKNEDNVEKIIDAFDCAVPTDTFTNSKHSHMNIYDFKKDNFIIVDWYV